MPLFLPPLLFKHYKEHMPSKGTLTKEEDRKFIQSLEVRSQCYLNHALVGYKGARNASKQRHGRGIEIFENGDVYGERAVGAFQTLRRGYWCGPPLSSLESSPDSCVRRWPVGERSPPRPWHLSLVMGRYL